MAKLWNSRWPVRAGVAFALVTLAGCQTTAKMETVESTSYTSRHPIVVTSDTMNLTVRGNKKRRGLTNVQRARIQSFIANYKDSGAGALTIKSPSSLANDVAAAGAAAEVRRIIERSAIPRSSIRVVNYRPRNTRVSSPVVLSYRHYAAYANKCGAWPDDSSVTKTNAPTWSFGCASQSNLAAMIANPRDLIVPRNSDPADAQRRDRVFDKYRKGAVTTAARSASETGQVSSVAK